MSNTSSFAAPVAFNFTSLLVKTLFGFLVVLGLESQIPNESLYRLVVVALSLGLCFSAFLPGSWLRKLGSFLFDTLYCCFGVVALVWSIHHALRQADAVWMLSPALVGGSWLFFMHEFRLGAWSDRREDPDHPEGGGPSAHRRTLLTGNADESPYRSRLLRSPVAWDPNDRLDTPSLDWATHDDPLDPTSPTYWDPFRDVPNDPTSTTYQAIHDDDDRHDSSVRHDD